MAWVGVITNGGRSLLNEWTAGEQTLYITKAKSGSGVVQEINLRAQTDVTGLIGIESIAKVQREENATRYDVHVPAKSSAVVLKQIGIFGKLNEDGAEALVALYQNIVGVEIPSSAQMPDFIYTLSAVIAMGEGDLTVNIDTSAIASVGMVDEKMDKENPECTGSFSMNRKEGSTVGNKSFAEGDEATASGSYSHAEGSGTTASGLASHAEGFYTSATKNYSHAEGCHTTASGSSSHAEGFRTYAEGEYSHAQGKCNAIDYDDKYADIIGNGVDYEHRSNASATDWNGNQYLAGDLYVHCNPDSTGGKKLRNEAVPVEYAADEDEYGFATGSVVGDVVCLNGKFITEGSAGMILATVPPEFAVEEDASFLASCDITQMSRSVVYCRLHRNFIQTFETGQAEGLECGFSLCYNIAKRNRGRGVDELEAALRSLSGMTKLFIRVNRTGKTASDGQPTGTIAVYFSGAAEASVAQCLADNNNTGLETWGVLSRTVTDSHGQQVTVKYSQASTIYALITLELTKKSGWQASTEDDLKTAIVDYVNKNSGVGFGLNVRAMKKAIAPGTNGLPDTYTIEMLSAGPTSSSRTTRILTIDDKKDIRTIKGNITVTYTN